MDGRLGVGARASRTGPREGVALGGGVGLYVVGAVEIIVDEICGMVVITGGGVSAWE